MQNFSMSMLWFWISYILVTCAGIVHTIINIYVLGMKPMDENGMGEGYEKTKPWHPLYNIISFSIFGFAYMNGLAEPTITEALITGTIWAGFFLHSSKQYQKRANSLLSNTPIIQNEFKLEKGKSLIAGIDLLKENINHTKNIGIALRYNF